jgi:hypothetical protein
VLTQDEAVDILEAGFNKIGALLEGLPPERLTEPGIGGDRWTAQDLIGHVAFWERAALEALDAWSDGGAAPIDRALARGITIVNRDALRRIRERSLEEVRTDAERVHFNLLLSIQEMGPDLWESLPTARHLNSLGESLGRILTGPEGPFTHAAAHMPDLEAFVKGASS